MDAADERYTIISADAHAGLPCEEYRPYLDPRHMAAFDEFLAERHAQRDEQMKLNYDYITNWETTHEEGLRGAYDPEQRDKEMDADGVAAEVIFPDADAITGMESPPFGAGLSAGTIEDPELAFAGARAHNRFLVELCATSPERRAGVGLVPITHDVDRAVAEIEWLAEHPGIRGIMVPTMWRHHRPYNDPAYDPVWAAAAAANFPVHTHSGEAPREEMGDFIGIYLAEVVWWTHRLDRASPVQRRVRTPPGPEGRRHRGRVVLGRRHEVEVGPVPRRRPHHEEDGRADEGHPLEAAVGVLRREHLRRRVDDVEGGDPAAARDRLRRRDVGHRLPAPRRDVAEHRARA